MSDIVDRLVSASVKERKKCLSDDGRIHFMAHDTWHASGLGREAADEIVRLRGELVFSRDTNRKLQRRMQVAEAASQSVDSILSAWIGFFLAPSVRDRRFKERHYVQYILRDIRSRASKLVERFERAQASEPTRQPDGYRHALHASDGRVVIRVDDAAEHSFGDDLHEGDRVVTTFLFAPETETAR